MSLRPAAGASPPTCAARAHQIRSTIAAARAAYALEEHRCAATAMDGDVAMGEAEPSEESRPTQSTVTYRGYLDKVPALVKEIKDRAPTQAYTYTLVDGRNIFAPGKPGELPKFQTNAAAAIAHAAGCLPPDNKSQVVVVWTWLEWTSRELNKSRFSAMQMQYANALNALREPGTSVFFAMINYTAKDLFENKVYTTCNGPVADEKQQTIVGRTKYKNEPFCKISNPEEPSKGMKLPEHLACEMDDVLITEMHDELLRNDCAVKVVSDDGGVLKRPEDVAKLKAWVANAGKYFYPSIKLVEVQTP